MVRFDVVVSPKRKSTKWTVNIERTTLKDLKDYIRELYTPPALENDGAEPNFMSDEIDIHIGTILHSKRCCSCSCQLNLLYLLRRHQIHSATFPKVCELYGLSDDPSPSIDVYPITPLDMAYEATKSIYFHCYLASGVSFYEDDFKIIPEKLIEEFKREDFMKRFTQGSVQMESSLTGRKRKAEEIDDGLVVDREAQKPVEDSQSGVKENDSNRNTGSSEVTAQNIVDLFRVAMKVRQKEIHAGIVTTRRMRAGSRMSSLQTTLMINRREHCYTTRSLASENVHTIYGN
uniref:Uncharacterized protein n=1 Tax=Rhizophagus irregularis (strain DAOM 181602 / DAOM 197198 / MUCL 43194) TaxID=747089 RepID=U9T0R8_RHIID